MKKKTLVAVVAIAAWFYVHCNITYSWLHWHRLFLFFVVSAAAAIAVTEKWLWQKDRLMTQSISNWSSKLNDISHHSNKIWRALWMMSHTKRHTYKCTHYDSGIPLSLWPIPASNLFYSFSIGFVSNKSTEANTKNELNFSKTVSKNVSSTMSP